MQRSRPESLREVVWNDRSQRLRTPWRLLGAIVVLAVLGLAVGLVAVALVGVIETLLIEAVPDASVVRAGLAIAEIGLGTAIICGGIYLAARLLDRRRFADLGLRVDTDWWLDLVFGLLLGGALMSGIFLVEYAAGWVTVTGTFSIEQGASTSFWPWFGVSVAFWLAVGFYEELLTRGYLLVNLAEGFTWGDRLGATGAVGLAAVASSLVFAVLHAANPNASLASTTGIFLAGLMLAGGYVLTGELAIPIGIHVTWNFFQGTVYGFPVSGAGFGVSLVGIEQGGPAWLTGGSFGPEAGVLGVAASVVGIGLIAVWAWRREGRLAIHPSITTPNFRTDDASGPESEPGPGPAE